jgi:hypothetical protein
MASTFESKSKEEETVAKPDKDDKPRERKPLKTDFISILIYIAIFVILYYAFFIIAYFYIVFTSIPGTTYFRKEVFEDPLYMKVKTGVWEGVYSRPIFSVLSILLILILILILICWFFYALFLGIPLGIGWLLIEAIPPLKRFEQAGFYRLVDDSIDVVGKFMPVNWFVAFLMWFLGLQRFCTERIIDIALLVNPDLDLEPSKFIQNIDEIQSDIKTNPYKFTWTSMNQRLRENMGGDDTTTTEGFANKEDDNDKDKKKKTEQKKKEEEEQENAEQNIDKIKHKDLHKEGTEEMIRMKAQADMYKNLERITPNMSMIERTSVIFNNQLKMITMSVSNVKPTIDISMATLPKG